MWLKYLPILGMCCLGLSPLLAQTELINADLSSLYQYTVQNSPTVKRQQIQNQLADAARQTARSQFDFLLLADVSTSRAGYNLMALDPRRSVVGNEINTNDMQLSAQVQRTFRTGTLASIGVAYQRTADSYPLTVFNEQVGAFFADNSTSTSLSITQPLLRGRGRSIVTANETLAGLGLESQQENAVFVISGQVFNTVAAYWQYRGATESFQVYQDNEARVRSVLEVTEQLVAGDKKPAGDLTQVRADLTDKERQTVAAQQALFAARQNLGRSIGLSADASAGLTAPESVFPSLASDADLPTLEELLQIARANRADLKSLRKFLAQQLTQLEVAENNLKPQLNLTAFGSYGGVAMGNGVDRFFRALANDEGRQTQVGVGLNYQFPINNNLAEAAVVSAQLQIADQETFLNDQIRNIELNVSISYNNYLNSVEIVRKAQQSLGYYQDVFTNEQYKFQNGLTTLLNLIIMQERLTFAQLEYIQAQQQYAIAISSLRYESGTLYRAVQSGPVDVSIFYSLPTANQ